MPDCNQSQIRPSAITFLMIGAQRCGTTWVDAALRGHDQVYLPTQKQSYFFDIHFDKGHDWYLENFRGIEPHHKAVGEIATGYCLTRVFPRIAHFLPHVKLIMAVRHPVDRAYSNFQVRQHQEKWKSFEHALDQSQDLMERGQYIDQIERVLTYYDRSRFLLLFYDDLENDPQSYLSSILRFLKVDERFDTDVIYQRKNAALYPRIRRMLYSIGLKKVVVGASQSSLGDVIRRFTKTRGKNRYASMNLETRNRLIEHFRPFNDRLSEFAGRDLSCWHK